MHIGRIQQLHQYSCGSIANAFAYGPSQPFCVTGRRLNLKKAADSTDVAVKEFGDAELGARLLVLLEFLNS